LPALDVLEMIDREHLFTDPWMTVVEATVVAVVCGKADSPRGPKFRVHAANRLL